MLLLSLLFPISIGTFIVNILLPKNKNGHPDVIFALCLASGLGFGISSGLYLIWLISFNSMSNAFILAEFVLILSLFFIHAWLNKKRKYFLFIEANERLIPESAINKVLSFFFYSALVTTITIFIIWSLYRPHGGWDALVVWNLRARFLFLGGEHWKDAFSTLLYWPYHADYPLLIPANVARCWTYVGKVTQIAPSAIGMFFTFATVCLIFSSLSILKSKNQGYLAGITLLGTTGFIILGVAQYADVPLGFYFLATFVLLCFQDKLQKYYGISSLAGMMAGFSCWTKNEGLLFFATIIVVRLMVIILSRHKKMYITSTKYFVLGAMPVLVLLIYFKTSIAPPGDLIAGQQVNHILEKILDNSRYLKISMVFVKYIFKTLPLVFFLLIYPVYFGLGSDKLIKKNVLMSFCVLGLMLTGYYMIFIISPYNLAWHLDTSLWRLLIQLWPSFLFAYFMIVRTPEEVFFHERKAD
jgi:hypothetical protein